MNWMFVYLISCIICCVLTVFYRKGLGLETRGQMFAALVGSCIPFLNVGLWCLFLYFVYAHVWFSEWLKKPLGK